MTSGEGTFVMVVSFSVGGEDTIDGPSSCSSSVFLSFLCFSLSFVTCSSSRPSSFFLEANLVMDNKGFIFAANQRSLEAHWIRIAQNCQNNTIVPRMPHPAHSHLRASVVLNG